MKLTKLFTDFFESEKSSGILLLICAALSIGLANSPIAENYLHIWETNVAGHHLDHWVNDGLMAIFFLLIGLELEREIYIGELSNFKQALLPIMAALGGMLVPAGIHLLFNHGTPAQAGAGIPMATDIAFALGVLSLLGKRVPPVLKVFLTALAVIDDLGAILVIAVFYSDTISFAYLALSLGVFAVLGILNCVKVRNLIPYLIGGVAMWYFMLHSGVHATISGVLLAFVIPFGNGNEKSTSFRLQHFLHKPVAFGIIPVFALANTAIPIDASVIGNIFSANTAGIFLGLFLGKPLGIGLFTAGAVAAGLCTKPAEMSWGHVVGLGFLGGIGFTMSIFITLLAFDSAEFINTSKIAIIATSAASAIVGLILLKLLLKKREASLEEMAETQPS
jgi:NhaA family Na+:H+ antiporter